MKELISAKDIEEHIKTEEKVMVVDTDAIVTPFANDVAKNNGIRIIKKDDFKESDMQDIMPVSEEKNQEELILNVLKVIFQNDWQSKNIDIVKGIVEKSENGFKLIKGKTVSMSKMNIELIEGNAYFSDFHFNDEKTHKARILNLEDSVFKKMMPCSEVNYIVSGKLKISIDNETFTAYTGDTLYIPANCETKWQCEGQLVIFSVGY